MPNKIPPLKPPEFEVPLAHAPAGSFKNAKEVRQWAKRELQGRSIKNLETGMDVLISRSSLDKFTSASAALKSVDARTHFDAVRALPDLIQNAIEGERREDRVQAENIQAVHRFFAPVEIGGIIYRVKLTVFSHRNPDNARLYTHELAEIKMPAESPAQAGETPATAFHAGTVIKLYDLLCGVKRDDGTEYFSGPPAKKSKAQKGVS